jgi:hypothetical protein
VAPHKLVADKADKHKLVTDKADKHKRDSETRTSSTY